MSRDIIETIEYKGFNIQVIPDYDYQHDDDGMGQLHCDSRDLYIGAIRKNGKEVKKPITIGYSVREFLDILEDNHIFYGSYGSHSGQWLNAMRGEITKNFLTKPAIEQYKKEYPTKEDREAYTEEDFFSDTAFEDIQDIVTNRQCADVLLIIPRDLWGNTKQSPHDLAASCWQYWDDVIRGNVYGFNIIDNDGDDIDDVEYQGGSCWGFVGDLYNYNKTKPEERDGYMLHEAKRVIDSLNAKEYYKTKYKKQIAAYADTIKTLSSKII